MRTDIPELEKTKKKYIRRLNKYKKELEVLIEEKEMLAEDLREVFENRRTEENDLARMLDSCAEDESKKTDNDLGREQFDDMVRITKRAIKDCKSEERILKKQLKKLLEAEDELNVSIANISEYVMLYEYYIESAINFNILDMLHKGEARDVTKSELVKAVRHLMALCQSAYDVGDELCKKWSDSNKIPICELEEIIKMAYSGLNAYQEKIKKGIIISNKIAKEEDKS